MPPSIKQVRSRGSLDLVFKKVSMMHRGIYTCHAVNRLGKDTHFVIVIPIYFSIPRPPRVVPLHHVVTVSKGSTAVLVCSAKHTPQRYTALFWNHLGTRVTNTARHHIKSRYSERIVKKKYKDERVDMSLSIGHVGFKDVGLYTCGVVTDVGRHVGHVELRIKE
ncbi:peroxidasin homolog [Actinia tenebrosa]|uniref:Peroxidasin homolog n=1 Tax=Actinia tenebrosa TaxID=6105 RepID=A0A6P8HHW5_ACTTE|nr:peroxidasin homolog [Actinia tenebrosa]